MLALLQAVRFGLETATALAEMESIRQSQQVATPLLTLLVDLVQPLTA